MREFIRPDRQIRSEGGAVLRHEAQQAGDARCVDNGLSASDDRKGQAAIQRSYFNGRNSSATVSCSGTSGKKARRWQ